MESDVLLARRRKARQGTVKVGDYTFTFRRPTEIEAAKIQGDYTAFDVAVEFVCGWSDNVTEAVLIPGGASDPATFSKELWADWCADRSEFWPPIMKAITEAYVNYTQGKTDSGND